MSLRGDSLGRTVPRCTRCYPYKQVSIVNSISSLPSIGHLSELSPDSWCSFTECCTPYMRVSSVVVKYRVAGCETKLLAMLV